METKSWIVRTLFFTQRRKFLVRHFLKTEDNKGKALVNQAKYTLMMRGRIRVQ